jgi:hypothetical protein
VAGINDSNAVDVNDRSETVIWGNDATSAANGPVSIINDGTIKRLAVTAKTVNVSLIIPIYEEMALARDFIVTALSGWNTVYSYSGAGQFYGFLINLEGGYGETWSVRVVIDTKEVFGANGIYYPDIGDNNIFDIKDITTTTGARVLGITAHDNCFQYSPNAPIDFTTSVAIYVKKTGANKKVRASLINIAKA